MTGNTFKKFLESENEKNPLRLKGYVNKVEVLREVEHLANRISVNDYEAVCNFLMSRSFTSIAYILKKYGLTFKGLTHMETLIRELIKRMKKSEI